MKDRVNHSWTSKWITGTFLLMIGIGTVVSIVAPKRTFSENENRFLQQFPEINKDAIFDGTFEEEYEAFVTDQFILRDQWIALKTYTERLLQKKDINGVYFADDGYLIERHNAQEIDQQRAETNVDRLAEFIRKASEQYGTEHVRVMLVPTASEILTNKLPAFASGYDQMSIIHKLEKMVPESCVVNVTETLKSHNEEYIYYKTDHHWTTLGAYYAYVDWARSIGIEPLEQKDFNIKQVSKNFFGTIASKVNITVEPDEMFVYETLGNPKYTVEYNAMEETNSLYDYDALQTKDKYSVYLRGNNALVKIKTEQNNGRKLLVIKDSYSHCFVPLLVDHFEEIQMIDFRYFNLPLSEFMEQNEFTDVLVLYNVIGFVEDIHSLSFVK